MANAGVEYMVSESWGSNPVPLDYLWWVPLTDFVAIDYGVNAERTTSTNQSPVEPELQRWKHRARPSFQFLSPLDLFGANAWEDYIRSVNRAFDE